MRIDKWLKVSRIIKRREIAKELCDDNDVYINGRLAKPSSEVAPGDKLLLIMGKHKVEVEVAEIRPYAKKEQVESMFQIVSDTVEE